MITMICVDSNGGAMFNSRRQSQDRRLRERILSIAGERRVWMSAYSARQFELENQSRLAVREDFLTVAGDGELCFVEGHPLQPFIEKMEALVLYRWNRSYPADTWLDIPLAEHGWRLQRSFEFAGYSHEKITEEVYVK